MVERNVHTECQSSPSGDSRPRDDHRYDKDIKCIMAPACVRSKPLSKLHSTAVYIRDNDSTATKSNYFAGNTFDVASFMLLNLVYFPVHYNPNPIGVKVSQDKRDLEFLN
ncbi:hypothetical protein Bbelb_086590 [Branchiostoma belcheri]|nr:hypothetical protein Bbelb_086590 [Branchiostoma belcheri]